MAFAVAIMILASVWTQQVTAKCNKDVVDKIKALNLDNTKLMDNMVGDFKIVSMEAGKTTKWPESDIVCTTISFLKVDGTYKVDYRKMNAGVRNLVQKGDGVFKHVGGDDDPEMTYYPVRSTHDSLAFYVCYEEEVDDLWFVLVPVEATDYAKQTEEARKSFKKVGLPEGINFPACEKVTTLAEADKTEENLPKPDETKTGVKPDGADKQ